MDLVIWGLERALLCHLNNLGIFSVSLQQLRLVEQHPPGDWDAPELLSLLMKTCLLSQAFGPGD